MTNSFTPAPLSVPDTDIDDLHRRLAHARWPVGATDPTWSRGVPRTALEPLAEHWRTGFDWRAVEAQVNACAPVTTIVDGQPVHLLHVRSPERDALPLLLCHGWPSSPLEFLDVIGPLTDPRAHGGNPADAFHVVVPSLPGFGFSPPLIDLDWDVNRIARVFAEVMARLGYDRYAVQGGDVGSAVAGSLALHDAEHVAAYHVVTDVLAVAAVASFSGRSLDPADFAEDDLATMERMAAFARDGLAYIALQSSRPATLGYLLEDSPLGQLAWTAEKFQEWSGPGLRGPAGWDRLLATVSATWFHHNGAASANLLYGQSRAAQEWGAKPSAAMGWSVFGGGGDVVRSIVDPTGELPWFVSHDEGGHFAALEEPGLYVEDLRAFFRTVR